VVRLPARAREAYPTSCTVKQRVPGALCPGKEAEASCSLHTHPSSADVKIADVHSATIEFPEYPQRVPGV
jgi:hypothetical protein